MGEGLVRCPTCSDALVERGRTCFGCKKKATVPLDEPRDVREREKPEGRPRKLGRLTIPAAPIGDIATHRRVQGDGRRWR